jgi:NADH-quinone oxidoreductase subunit A
MPSYLPIVILGVIAFGFGVFVLVASHIIGRPRPDAGKLSTYECGVPPVGNARERFPIKFYLVCMLFILFDVETAFFYPWALAMDTLGVYGLTVMGGFFLVLGVGFVYEWKVGAMDW